LKDDVMTCYTRHLTDVIRELNLEDTRENRKFLDRKIRIFLKREKDGCSKVWKEVKEQIHDSAKRGLLIEELRKDLGTR